MFSRPLNVVSILAKELVAEARLSLERMIEITEAAAKT